MRRDLSVIFNDGVEPGLETEVSGFRIEFAIRGRVYCVYEREPRLVGTIFILGGMGKMEKRPYGTLDLKGFGVGDMIRLEFDGAGIEGRKKGFSETEFGHRVRDRMRLLGRYVVRLCIVRLVAGLDDDCQGPSTQVAKPG